MKKYEGIGFISEDKKIAEIAILLIYPTLFFFALFTGGMSKQIIGLSVLLGAILILLSIVDLRTFLLPNILIFFC